MVIFFFLFKSVANIKPLYNQISCAYYREEYIRKNGRNVRRRGGGWDENITAENRQFLDEVVIKSYEKKETSPLKDGPWVKGEWSSDFRFVKIKSIDF